jgi:hypothetical protein
LHCRKTPPEEVPDVSAMRQRVRTLPITFFFPFSFRDFGRHFRPRPAFFGQIS